MPDEPAIDALRETLNRPKSYAIDGESVTMPSPSEAVAALEWARAGKLRDPWRALGMAKIHTGEAGR